MLAAPWNAAGNSRRRAAIANLRGHMATNDDPYLALRERMVEEQMRDRDIRDPRVLEAMRAVPRHLFVPEDMRHLAYADAPLPIGHRQTISQPYIVALMTQLLGLQGGEIVLEVGTGSGYQAAVLAHIACQVYSLERISALAQRARRNLVQLGIHNVEVIECDGSRGLPEKAPFQAIIVTAATPRVPEPLKQQLSDGGRLVLPVGSRLGQMLERFTRRGDEFQREMLTPVSFVPLIGSFGWSTEDVP
jgi:protein-L-isoaspartate(D-aspartate) O-methyltransferase